MLRLLRWGSGAGNGRGGDSGRGSGPDARGGEIGAGTEATWRVRVFPFGSEGVGEFIKNKVFLPFMVVYPRLSPFIPG